MVTSCKIVSFVIQLIIYIKKGFLIMENKRCFASDNYSGIHPRILESITKANIGHVMGYGDDPYTLEAKRILMKEFEAEEVVFVYNGTGANVLSLDSMVEKYSSILCAESAHINTHEVGAPVRITGCPLFTIPSEDGKFDIQEAKKLLGYIGGQHHSQPRVISITQPTELGAVYSNEEVKAIADFAHNNGMLLHMDGARLSNAAVALDSGLKEITKDLGVDVVTFGGTKNGLMYGEAIIYFCRESAKGIKYLKKQNLQLHSKMRFLSVQFIPYVEEKLWYTNAKTANDMAYLLERELGMVEGVEISQKAHANTLYVKVPKEIIKELQEEYYFYIWDDNEIRLVTTFDIQEEDVIGFVNKVEELIGNLEKKEKSA